MASGGRGNGKTPKNHKWLCAGLSKKPTNSVLVICCDNRGKRANLGDPCSASPACGSRFARPERGPNSVQTAGLLDGPGHRRPTGPAFHDSDSLGVGACGLAV